MKEQVNFKRFRNRMFLIIALTVLTFFFADSSNWNDIPIPPNKRLSGHPFAPESALTERIKPIPKPVLAELEELDNRNDYAPYMPDSGEIAAIAAVFETFPPLNIKIMKERLAAIYFVTNLATSGLTEWLLNERSEIYTYIVINPAALKMSLDELLVWKERSCFINDDGNFEIKISVSAGQKGFIYIMLHESCHVVDYVLGITPFTEPQIKFLREVPQETDFTRGIWRSYDRSAVYYKFRERLSFYQNPQVKISEAESLYREMPASPFISLYGSLNWAEDVCEFLAFYHLTEKMGMDYKIEVKQNGKTNCLIKPARQEQVRKRFKNLKVFYESRKSDTSKNNYQEK